MDKQSEHAVSVSVGGREISFETGKIARQANGAVILRCGETMLMATACSSPLPLDDVDFLPLRVDYQEKFSSTGKTLGGYLKREGRPTQKEILTCRLIDRPLRPMFEKGYYHEIQLLTYVLSYDGVHVPDPLAICAASAALVISDIPLIKPVAAVQVALIGERFVINPTLQEMEKSKLDLMLAGTEDAILMIEGFADFLTEEQILEAVEEGHQAIAEICRALSEWQNIVGKPKILDTLRLSTKLQFTPSITRSGQNWSRLGRRTLPTMVKRWTPARRSRRSDRAPAPGRVHPCGTPSSASGSAAPLSANT